MNLLLAVVLTASAWTGEIWIEAEDAGHFGVTVDSTRAGYSGRGYVTGFDAVGDSVVFRFEAEKGVYALSLGMSTAARFNPYEVWVDGERTSGNAVGGGGRFGERALGKFLLADGPHTIVVAGSAGIDLDYLRLVPDVLEVPPKELSDPQATSSARALFGFLVDTYGKKVLSGQQELREVDFLTSVTGREVAVAGGDLIVYSPSRRERDEHPDKEKSYASVEDYIEWAQDDGIVAMMWHWNAPTDFVDDAEWWRGFYTDGTTFDFAAALADTTSERYRLMLRDIDAIAVQLRKFEDADVPLLWRPLHEAAGGWFWWGARGAEPFKELWRLLYDRLVNLHGLHNLIWVYTHQPGAEAWYPGDEYVDVVSRDVYADDPASLMRTDWDEMQRLFGGEKLVTLSESGTLPDPDLYTEYGVWWSWFSVWNDWPGDGRDDYVRGMDPEYLRQVFGSEVVLTRDELPAWRSNALPAEPTAPAPEAGLTLHPNPTTGPAVLRVTLPAPADVRVEVFDVLGRRVRAYALGIRPAGVFETTVDAGVAAGVYVVRVVAGRYVAHRTFVVAR